MPRSTMITWERPPCGTPSGNSCKGCCCRAIGSPDFNPVEHLFSKVRPPLRRAESRTDNELRAVTITMTDAAGWFAHDGYLERVRST